MKHFPPPAADVLPLIDPLRLPLWNALSQGCRAAAGYFAARDRSVDDPHLFAHLVRDEVHEVLRRPGVAPEGLRVKRLQMAGIMLSGSGFVLRAFKAERVENIDGSVERQVPGPGQSALRREYYAQPTLLLDPARPLLQEVNLVLIWDIGPEYGLTTVDLACPRVWDEQASRVDNHWMVPWGRAVEGVDSGRQEDRTLLPDFNQIRARQPDDRRAAGDANPG